MISKTKPRNQVVDHEREAAHKERSCTSKAFFTTQREALSRASELGGRTVYPCKFCKGWHLARQLE